MANKLHISDTSSISVTTLVLSDEAGTGPCTIQPPSGVSIQMLGLRQGYSNKTTNYTIQLEESNYVWTNTGGSALTFTLPSGAQEGFNAWFVRTGGEVSVYPDTVGQIWHSSSGVFRDAGTSVVLGSGSKIRLICDGSNGWYPTLEEGTIT